MDDYIGAADSYGDTDSRRGLVKAVSRDSLASPSVSTEHLIPDDAPKADLESPVAIHTDRRRSRHPSSSSSSPSLASQLSAPRTRRTEVLAAVMLGFTGYYYLRNNLAVVSPLLLAALPSIDRADFGVILSAGYLCYAAGKLVSGPLIDRFGGARMFIGGFIGSLVACLCFTAVPTSLAPRHQLALYVLCWGGNRLAQSAGWGSVVQLVGAQFPASMHGRAFGVASLSYGAGDVLVRGSLGLLLRYWPPPTVSVAAAGGRDGQQPELLQEWATATWHRVFYASMAAACALLVPTVWLLRGVALDRAVESESNESKPKESSQHPPQSVWDTVARLVRLPKFWLLLGLAPCLALVRETIAAWAAVLCTDLLRMSPGRAAMLTTLFPLMGTVSTLLGGWLMDRCAPARRGLIAVLCLSCLTTVLAMCSVLTATLADTNMAVIGGTDSDTRLTVAAAAALSLSALFLMAPFSFVDGVLVTALAAQSGGGSGVAVGVISCAGYTGAILAGGTMGSVADQQGWHHVLLLLASVSAAAFLLAIGYWTADLHQQHRAVRSSTLFHRRVLAEYSAVQRSADSLGDTDVAVTRP